MAVASPYLYSGLDELVCRPEKYRAGDRSRSSAPAFSEQHDEEHSCPGQFPVVVRGPPSSQSHVQALIPLKMDGWTDGSSGEQG